MSDIITNYKITDRPPSPDDYVYLVLTVILLIGSYVVIEIDSNGNVNHMAHILGASSAIFFVLLTSKITPPQTLYSKLPSMNIKKRPFEESV